MVEAKEIKLVKLAPFTLMTSAVSAFLAFIVAIVMLIVLGLVSIAVPGSRIYGTVLISLGASVIILYPIGSFFINLAVNFFNAFLYNNLAPRLGGIKLGLDGDDLNDVPVISFALILASIEAIWAFIIGVFLAALMIPFTTLLTSSIPVISQAIANATNASGAALPTGAAIGAGSAILAVFLIIGLPIIVFIAGFIGHSIFALIYNYIVTKASKIKLEFTTISGSIHELTSIPIIPAALSISILFLIIGIIVGLINLITLSIRGFPVAGLTSLILNIIQYFIESFIITALAAIVYNYLVPKIGGIKINLE